MGRLPGALSPRLIAVDRAVERMPPGRRRGPHGNRVAAQELANCRRLATWLQRDDRLNPSWTVRTATDMLYALISSDLIDDRYWPTLRLRTHPGCR
jgi:hypothetical protein